MKWILMASGALVLVIIAFIAGKRGVNPMKAVRLQLDVIDAKARAKKLLVNKDASDVRRQIEAEHKETIERFDSEQKERATQLADDPVALAAFLVRAGKG
jgi:hypothetical protein